jgi:hypothetical protein
MEVYELKVLEGNVSPSFSLVDEVKFPKVVLLTFLTVCEERLENFTFKLAVNFFWMMASLTFVLSSEIAKPQQASRSKTIRYGLIML